VVNFLAQFKVSPQPVDRFLEFDTKTLLDEVYSDSYLKLPMKGKDTTAAPRFSIVAPIGKKLALFYLMLRLTFSFKVQERQNLSTISHLLRRYLSSILIGRFMKIYWGI
jgi:hypothetical protein